MAATAFLPQGSLNRMRDRLSVLGLRRVRDLPRG